MICIAVAASRVPTMSDRVNNNNTKHNMRVTHSTCKQAVPPAWDEGWPHPCPTDEMKGWSFFGFFWARQKRQCGEGGGGACRDKEVKCCRWVKMADKDKQNHLAWSLLSMKSSTAVPSRQLQSMSVSQLTINVVVYGINQTAWGGGLFPDFFIQRHGEKALQQHKNNPLVTNAMIIFQAAMINFKH